ncbi:MAG: hypothetical protein JSS20_07355 [Proteobacteria bacterium]|nr:hypothetical protein [Pseudomonadota bacterium]
MTGWLINTDGEAVSEECPNLRSALMARLSSEELARYAVENMGWARIKLLRHGYQVSWRPTTLTELTFAGLLLELQQLQPARVAIETLTSDWSYRMLPSVEAAAQHLNGIFETAVCDGEEGYFSAGRRRPESLSSDCSLAELMRTANINITDPVALEGVLQAHAHRPFMLVHAAGEQAPLKLILWGDGFRRYQTSRLRAMADTSIEEQPDRAYGRRVAAAYRRVIATKTPILEDVTTSTWWPSRGRTWFSYTRLLTPIELIGRGTCVLSCSQDVVRLQPRFELAHKG